MEQQTKCVFILNLNTSKLFFVYYYYISTHLFTNIQNTLTSADQKIFQLAACKARQMTIIIQALNKPIP